MDMVRKVFGNKSLKDLTMERKRVEEFEESFNEDWGWINLVFLEGFSLKILSGSSLSFEGKNGIYTGVRMEYKESGFSKQGWLAAWLSREFQPQGNWTASCPFLSCSAPAGMTLQLLACLARVQLLATCSRKSPMRSSRESLFFLHTLEHFFTLSHSLPLQESHLNTELLIAEIKENLAWNKANKMVD